MTNLSLTDRHQHIINKLHQSGSVNVIELSKELNVSSVTIRKDLELLESKKLLFRNHGGATSTDPYITDRHVNDKIFIHEPEKERIGALAAQLLQPNDCILIASGTTVYYFAKHIKPSGTLTAVTSGLNVALELNQYSNIEVIQLGGIVRKTSSSVTGLYAENILKEFSFSKLFLGVDGIDPDFGLTTTNMMEAQLNKKMIEASQKTIVLADSSKFGKKGFGKICGLNAVQQIITDSNIPEHILTRLKKMGIDVKIADVTKL